MFKDKAQLKRDIILVGVVILVVVGILLFSLLTRVKGDVAQIKYKDILLFEVEMETGVFVAHTKDITLVEEPTISEDGQKIYLNSEEITTLSKGEGVLKYNNIYYIKGELGIIKIEYNSTTRMIRVVKETSPYNICSSQGFSNNAPIICLPNYVFITFSNSEVDDIIG